MNVKNQKRELESVLVKLNDLLTEHIDVHNAVFNPPLRAKVPVPFLFKKIDYEKLYHTSDEIQQKLMACLSAINTIGRDGTEEERGICERIKEYSVCFLASNSKITEITHDLHLKVMNERTLTFKEYNRLIQEYRQNEQARIDKGDMMNELVRIIRN